MKRHFTWFNFFDCVILQSKRLVGGMVSRNGLKVTIMRILGIRAGILGKNGRSLDLVTLREVK